LNDEFLLRFKGFYILLEIVSLIQNLKFKIPPPDGTKLGIWAAFIIIAITVAGIKVFFLWRTHILPGWSAGKQVTRLIL